MVFTLTPELVAEEPLVAEVRPEVEDAPVFEAVEGEDATALR
jgi:hypothetical protein